VYYLITKTPKQIPENGFQGTPKDWQEEAYRICYFFDYVGALAHWKTVKEERVV
jgi:hypothetical protein